MIFPWFTHAGKVSSVLNHRIRFLAHPINCPLTRKSSCWKYVDEFGWLSSARAADTLGSIYIGQFSPRYAFTSVEFCFIFFYKRNPLKNQINIVSHSRSPGYSDLGSSCWWFVFLFRLHRRGRTDNGTRQCSWRSEYTPDRLWTNWTIFSH